MKRIAIKRKTSPIVSKVHDSQNFNTVFVDMAQPYDPMQLGSFGKASTMLLRQFNFPHKYDKRLDYIISAYNDRCFQWDYKHASACYKKHAELNGHCYITKWVQESVDDKIVDFLKDILKVDKLQVIRVWTGYRITVSIRRDNGYPVYLFELFAKHPDSKTIVYSGFCAPNIDQQILQNVNLFH